MKNTKEVQAILTAVFAINQTSEHKDPDIALILDYAFRRLFESNTNLLILACIGKSKEIMMPEIQELLTSETQYNKYLEEYEKMDVEKALKKVSPLYEQYMAVQKRYPDPKLDYSAIIDAYGKFEKLWQFSAYLISKGYKVLEVGGKDKFGDGNIEPLPKPNDTTLFVRATDKGEPIQTEWNGKPAVMVKDRIYVPGTALPYKIQ